MTTFRLPVGVCKDLDSMVKHFWWDANNKEGMYLALKAWNDNCKPKAQGGLGFRMFSDFNMALLAKLKWKMGRMDEAFMGKDVLSQIPKGTIFL